MSSEYPQSEQEPEEELAKEMEQGQADSPSSPVTPGRMLKEARVAKNLKRYDIAQQMRLSVKWIKDIEHDRYFRASALIYVKGYLRNYAKLLDLSVEEILAAFDQLGVEKEFERIKEENLENHFIPRTISTFSYGKPPSPRRFMRWITVFSVLAAVLWLGIWWKGRHGVLPIQAVVSQPSSSAQSKELPVQPDVAPSTSSGNAQPGLIAPGAEPANDSLSGQQPPFPQAPKNAESLQASPSPHTGTESSSARPSSTPSPDLGKASGGSRVESQDQTHSKATNPPVPLDDEDD